jgi:hypothetical protein
MRLAFYTGRFYDSSTGTRNCCTRGCEPNIKAEEIAARSLATVYLAIGGPKVKATALTLTIYTSLARDTIYDVHFFPSGREITAYDVFTVIKLGKYNGS